MCRIAGLVSSKLNINEKRRLVVDMCGVMQHGGPDGEGQFLCDKNSICFGHRRLALIDLSENASQPMLDITGNFSITFNGEIYNYQKIKAELKNLGYQFFSHSDTEVILNAYAHWGTDAFHRFNGMFAFALFDKRLRKVFLVRDESGMKPLYYQTKNQELLFASEIRAFRKIGVGEENPDWKILFLAFGFIPEPTTVLKNVSMLPKGSFLEWNMADSTFAIKSYQVEKKSPPMSTGEEAEEVIRQKMNLAISRHLIADTPIGVFLSGGIDSGIIALEASKIKGENLHTLSLTFDDINCDESKFQQILAKKFHSNHHSYTITEKDFVQQSETIFHAMDQPSTDGINTWFVSQFAQKNGLKAVLSGLGGDELFGGYPSFKRISILQKLSFLPDRILQSFQYCPKENYQKLAYLSLHSNVGYYLALRGYFSPLQIAKVLNLNVKNIWNILQNIDNQLYNQQNNQLFTSHLEQHFYMKNQLLRDTDVMSMQHGTEIRMPFLDLELINMINGIDPSIRFDRKISKGLLIQSYRQQLPEEIWKRKKMGFSFPLQKWLKKHPITAQLKSNSNPNIASFTSGFLKDQIHWSKLLALYFTVDQS